VVACKSKLNLIVKGIGKGDSGKGGEDLLGEGHDSPKEALAKVGAAGGKGAGNATLSDGLLDIELPRSSRASTPHGPNALVAKRLAVDAIPKSQKEDQDAEAGYFEEND